MPNHRTSGLPRPLSEALKPALDARDGGRAREERLWRQIRARRSMGGHSEPPKAGQYLPVPLTSVLRSGDAVNERSRLWRGIREKRTARQNRADGSRSSWKWPALGFGLATAIFAIGFVTGVLPPASRSAQVAVVPALTLSDGKAVRPMDASEGPRVIRLADASEIRLDKGASVEPLLSSGSRFELLLRHGSAEFSVTPHGPRRWVIEAGLATVEVVGTVFRVERKADGVSVSVSRGTVLVRGEGVPDRVQRLTAGGSISVGRSVRTPVQAPGAEAEGPDTAAGETSLEVDAIGVGTAHDDAPPEMVVTEREVAAAAGMATYEGPKSAAGGARKPAAREARKPAAREAPWRTHLARGEFDTAYQALGEAGLSQEVRRTEAPQRLLELADVARLSGHPAQSIGPLDRLLSLHPSSPHAGIAAFTLGRVYLDQLQRPAEAAKAFERAITLHPPHALLADCHVRLVEAYARAGDMQSAERAASRYRTLFPTGRPLSDLSNYNQR